MYNLYFTHTISEGFGSNHFVFIVVVTVMKGKEFHVYSMPEKPKFFINFLIGLKEEMELVKQREMTA